MRTWVRSSASSRVKLADRVLDGLRLGLTLWLVQFQIFLNQTVRSRKPGRIAGFVVGVVLLLFWWVNIGALTLVAVSARASAPPVALVTILSIAFLFYTGVLLFSSLLFSLNALLLNPDLEILLTAPRSVESVLAARMVVQVLRMLVLSLLLTFPALAIPSVTGNPAVLPGFVLLLVLYPVPPIVLISVLTLALVRFVPAGRGKEIVALLGVAVGLTINVVNFLVNPAFRGSGFRRATVDATPGIVTNSWLPWSWAGRAAAGLLGGDLPAAVGWGLALLLASAGILVVGVLVSGRLYRAGWIQTVPGRHRRAAAGRRREWKTPGSINPVLAGIVLKDWRMRTRDVAQLVRFVMPVIFVLLLLGIRGSGLVSAVQAGGPGPLTALAGLVPASVLLLSLSGGLGLSAISLEGRAIWIYAASPNPIGRLLYAKCWASALPTVVATLLVAVLMEALVHPGWLWGTAAIAILAVQAVTLTALMVAIGGVWARFDWTDARRMMHPAAGILGFLAQLAIMGATALLAAGSVVLAGALHLEMATAFLAALVLAAAGAAVLAYGALVLAADRLRSLEVA